MTNPADDTLSSSLNVHGYIAQQADEIITEGTTWVELAGELDVSLYEEYDAYPDWHDSAPLRSMFLAYLWAKTEDESLSGIPDRLESHEDLAEAFGFPPDEIPDVSTFTPGRLEERRFDNLQGRVERAAQYIRRIAAERGSPIGANISRHSSSEGDEQSSPSKRTINRMVRQNAGDVLSEIKHVAYPALDLDRPENALYEDEELLSLEGVAAIDSLAANGAGEELGDLINPDPEIDDPLNEDGPSGETLLEAVKDLSVDQIADQMNFALRKIYTRAKPRLQELEHTEGKRFGVNVDVAFDITYVAYYGDRDGMDWLQGAPEDKEYRWCHKFATATIVENNTHYVVGVTPLGHTEYADTDAYAREDLSHYIGDVARRLLSIANQYVSIDMVYADREFFAVDVLSMLEKRGVDYIIPAVKNSRVQRLCDDFDDLKRGYNEENDIPLYVEQNFGMYGRMKHRSSNARVETNFVILPPGEEDPTRSKEEEQPFVTSLDLSDEIALDRRWAHNQIQRYHQRAAIEKSYTSIKECAAWTTSKQFEVRWFHFAFACLVYDLWLLVDFLVQERIGVIETRRKPRIRLKRFLDFLEGELRTLW